MNRLEIIGNLTREPETRTVETSKGPMSVCSFGVAVNTRRRGADNRPIPAFYDVSVWGKMGEACQKYLAKGRKVYVSGEPNARTYQAQDGNTRVSMGINAQEVEFLSSQNSGQSNGSTAPAYSAPAPAPYSDPSGFTPVETDELPF